MLRKSKRLNTNESSQNLYVRKVKEIESHISLVTLTPSKRGMALFLLPYK